MLCALLARRTERLLLASSFSRFPRPSIATLQRTFSMAPKRKAAALTNGHVLPPPPKRRASARNIGSIVATNPDLNPNVIDAPDALRASPDSDVNEDIVPGIVKVGDAPVSDVLDYAEPEKNTTNKKAPKKAKAVKDSVETPKKKPSTKAAVKKENVDEVPKNAAKKESDGGTLDPEADGDEVANEDEIKEALGRPPPVNSDFLPLPWKGRLGYACLNTYLRNSNPPVFSSRTCRIQSILEHRHPLQDPSQPEHATKNRPDKSKPADMELGKRYVEALGVANAKDIVKMIRWNDRYNIKFLRLSSEMFPFASHSEYGYKLTPFASKALEEAGKVIAELGHRVTTHPGQFTQLGSPRASVIENAKRDLEYHDELLSLLKLPEQEDRDAVMILHMGGIFEGKAETLDRFRKHYAELPAGVQKRLVLENDDVCWTVHDLLPVCEELNIPMVLDFHHHNILFDSSQIREGTKDIIDMYPRIKATWDRKRIRQKMHYSEPTPPAITGRQRRKHNPRVFTLPPCAPDMDLMIEAKDKEQAVFELMRNFRLPGHETFTEILPYMRDDDNKVAMAIANNKNKKKSPDELQTVLIPEEDVGMGGAEGRVYWPMGMEEYLRPKKREVKKKEPKSSEQLKKQALELYAAREAEKAAAKDVVSVKEEKEESDLEATPATKKAKAAMRAKSKADAHRAAVKVAAAEIKAHAKSNKAVGKKGAKKVKKEGKEEPELESEEGEDPELKDQNTVKARSKRGGKGKVNYNEEGAGREEESQRGRR